VRGLGVAVGGGRKGKKNGENDEKKKYQKNLVVSEKFRNFVT
jgi:hypothetical protein